MEAWRLRVLLPWLLLAAVCVFLILGGLATGRKELRPGAGSPEQRTANGHPKFVWSAGDAVPWSRLTDARIRRMTLEKASSRFTTAEHGSMGHFCTRPVFLQRRKPVIVLASVPGSGNFWTRYLIEQLTGVYTGSIYTETVSKTHMAGGQWRNASVIAVKSHSILLGDEMKFDGVILLLRNPFDAAKAEFSREATGKHTLAASVGAFQNAGDRLAKNAAISGSRFEKLTAFWIGVGTGRPLHIVYFEDLVGNLEAELRKLAAFLNIEVSEERIQCVLEHREGVNKRKHPAAYQQLDPFTPEMTTTMNHHLRAAARILPRVNQYLRPEAQGVQVQVLTERVGDIRRRKKALGVS